MGGAMFYEDITNRTHVDIAQSDTTIHRPHLKGVIILAAGTLKFQDAEDNIHTVVFPAAAAGGSYPFDLHGRIRRIYDTDTTLTDAQMLGYH